MFKYILIFVVFYIVFKFIFKFAFFSLFDFFLIQFSPINKIDKKYFYNEIEI